jgi:hypothetical protein
MDLVVYEIILNNMERRLCTIKKSSPLANGLGRLKSGAIWKIGLNQQNYNFIFDRAI